MGQKDVDKSVDEPNDELKEKASSIKVYAQLTGLGFELVAFVLAGLFLSQKLEEKMNLNGLGPAIFLFLALGLWIYRVIVTLNNIEKSDQIKKPNK